MAGKRLTSDEIVARLRQVDVLSSQGKAVAEAVRAIGVTEVTYYRWRKEYGGLKGDQVKRLKALEAENTRLRRAVSDLTLDKMILAPRHGRAECIWCIRRHLAADRSTCRQVAFARIQSGARQSLHRDRHSPTAVANFSRLA